jgi:hypothetical protein
MVLDEELGLKKRYFKNSRPHSELTHTVSTKSKSCSRSLEMATYPVRLLPAPSGLPLPWGRNLQHFFKSVLLPVPEYLRSISDGRADD